MKLSLKLLALMASMMVAGGAFAQSAGQYTAKLAVNKITPQVESGDVSAPALPHTKADVNADTEPVLGFTYSFTDNISTEFDLGLPYKHELVGAGAVQGIGKIGSVQSLPPTLFAQYRFFQPKAAFRPYVGVGLTYAYFYKATGSGQLTSITNIGSGSATTFKVDNKFAGTLQLGVTYNFSDRWFADLSATKTWLKTKVNFSTGQTQDVTLDPRAVMFGIGYKF